MKVIDGESDSILQDTDETLVISDSFETFHCFWMVQVTNPGLDYHLK